MVMWEVLIPCLSLCEKSVLYAMHDAGAATLGSVPKAFFDASWVLTGCRADNQRKQAFLDVYRFTEGELEIDGGGTIPAWVWEATAFASLAVFRLEHGTGSELDCMYHRFW